MKKITPKDLTGVGNGKLISQTVEKGKKCFHLGSKKTLSILYSIVPTIGKI